eukprot:364757-Chlamydomonas_euryale.AAC.12
MMGRIQGGKRGGGLDKGLKGRGSIAPPREQSTWRAFSAAPRRVKRRKAQKPRHAGRNALVVMDSLSLGAHASGADVAVRVLVVIMASHVVQPCPGATRHRGVLLIQGQGVLLIQGQGVLLIQGQGVLLIQGQGVLLIQGQGVLLIQGQGVLLIQGQGVLRRYGSYCVRKSLRKEQRVTSGSGSGSSGQGGTPCPCGGTPSKRRAGSELGGAAGAEVASASPHAEHA